MRSSDTFLTAMTDGEITAAVAALREQPAEIDQFELSLVTLER